MDVFYIVIPLCKMTLIAHIKRLKVNQWDDWLLVGDDIFLKRKVGDDMDRLHDEIEFIVGISFIDIDIDIDMAQDHLGQSLMSLQLGSTRLSYS